MHKRWTNKLPLALFVFLLVACVAFVLVRRNVVLNRYTDSWWHIAVADEVCKTGEFAKDPFIEDAPPFAQFGLMDFVNAKLCSLTGADTRTMFPRLVAGNVALFLVGAFLAGYWINRSMLQGLVSAVAWTVVYPGQTIIGLGFPFAAAVPLLAFFSVSLWCLGPLETLLPAARSMLWRGLLLGVTFNLHVFVGAVGCIVFGVWAIGRATAARDHEKRMALAAGTAVFGCGFLVAAWSWIVLHLSLRGDLSATNAHMRDSTTLDPYALRVLLLGVGIVALVLVVPWFGRVAAASHRGPAPRVDRRIAWNVFVMGGVLFIFSMPSLNNVVREHTSWYMAHRITWLFPTGVVVALAVSLLMEKPMGGKSWVSGLLLCGLLAVLLLPGAKTWVLKQMFLARTREYDEHAFGYLDKIQRVELEGRTVLADPTTSYYLRGMRGSYVLTVIPGEGSPAIDYGRREVRVRKALLAGPKATEHLGVDCVFLDRENSAVRRFTGHDVDEIVATWRSAGWETAVNNANVAILYPPETGAQQEREAGPGSSP